MRYAVVGIGGVGGYFGGRLIEAGADVTLIARGAHLAALQHDGLRITSVAGDLHLPQVRATDDPATVGPVDLVIVATKAWQLPAALEAARPLIGPQTGVLPLLNGVEAADTIAATYGDGHALDGICFIYAHLAGPGHIRHVGMQPSVTFGERDNARSARAEALREALLAAGVEVIIPDDIRAAVWAKFVFGATTSGLGAVTRTPLDVLRTIPQTRALLEGGMAEIVAVGQAHGVALSQANIERAMAQVDRLPPNTTASMQRDIMEGRPSELYAQNGAVVRLAAAGSVAVPIHQMLYELLLPQELRARG